ncbi:MAG: peptidylprolyl isomerase [Clostridiales bacterium]|jgi:parvulin-like peptidyl-prolyl isomerase|nr:peptidylprolyl isomerase [Clostridiales bacterium]
MKKILFLIAIIIFSVPAFASDISVNVNGNPVSFEQPPVNSDGRILVPLRAIFEALGATVEWNPATQTVTAERNDINISLTIGSEVLIRNNELITLDIPAQIVGDRTFVPTRAIAESFGAEVGWEQDTQTVTIITPQSSREILTAMLNVPVATVNGRNLNADIVSIMVQGAMQTLYADYYSMPADEWERAVLEEAVRQSAILAIAAEHAEQLNITLTQDEIDEYTANINEMIQVYGEAEFYEMLFSYGFVNIEHLITTDMQYGLADKVLEAIITDADLFAPFASYAEEESEEEIFAAKHIMITLDDFENEEDAFVHAKEIHARAIAGEDFDALIAEFGQDPGMETYPQGYTFIAEVMTPEFEEATRNLEIGEISEPILTEYGIHIIMRTEPDLKDIIRPWWDSPLTPEQRKINAVIAAFEEQAENAEIIFLPELYLISVN